MTKEKFNELKKELEEKLDIIISEDDFKKDLIEVSLDDIQEYIIDDNNMLNEDIIYYHNAIEFLKENDPSLNNSLEIAEELGYSIKDLNSELLASLLKTRMNEETFYNIIKKYEDED